MLKRISPDRSGLRAIVWSAIALGLVGLFVGCSASQVDTLQISPATQSLAVGQTAQFTATGAIGHGQHPSSSTNVTGTVTWASSAPAVASISASGVATAVSPGTTTITASMAGFGGTISSTATVTVTGTTGSAGTDIVSVSVIPGTQSVASPNETSQFIAIGTNSAGATVNVTNQVAWNSSSAAVATIGASTGLASGVSQGTATISAIYTNSDKTVATGTATFMVIGGTTEQVTAMTIYPGTQSATQAQENQFFVLGTVGSTGLQEDVSSKVTWSSSNLAVATVGTSGSGTPGLATAVGAGSTTITATYTNADASKVVATATYSVTVGAAQEPLLSINIVPGDVVVSNKGMTAQYLAFGTYSTTPTVRDITNSVTWVSTFPEVVSVESGGTSGAIGGLATAQGYTGGGVIYAMDTKTNTDGTVVLSNPQTFTCKEPISQVCIQTVAHPQLATLTVYIAGEGTTPGFVTAPSDTGTPNLIHCGPGWSGAGGQVCTGTYETGSTVVLTASPTGTTFGGWSSGDGFPGVGCAPDPGTTLATSPDCTVVLNGNTSVGAIFY